MTSTETFFEFAQSLSLVWIALGIWGIYLRLSEIYYYWKGRK